MKVSLIQITPDPEKHIGYIAEYQTLQNQGNPNVSKLIQYCIKHEHWSIFEQSFMTLEIETSRGIAAQILRHRSFTFQEFSQRYADTNLLDNNIKIPELRRQDTKNRQNSIDDLDDDLLSDLNNKIKNHFKASMKLYNELISNNVAKECARFVLPLSTPTRIYMSGSCRSWIHYIKLRSANGTQKEHMDIANECKSIFCNNFPNIALALNGDKID